MTKNDILLIQNVAESPDIEFEERLLTFVKGALISADVDGIPKRIDIGSDGSVLMADSNETTGLKWVAQAMILKGTVGSGGTYEIAAFNSLATYLAGWVYMVITDGTIKGQECVANDLLLCIVSRSGSGNVDADWIKIGSSGTGIGGGASSYTLDFQASAVVMNDINLEGAITITDIIGLNVASLKLDNVAQALGSGLSIAVADQQILAWEITRTAPGYAALGIKFTK